MSYPLVKNAVSQIQARGTMSLSDRDEILGSTGRYLDADEQRILCELRNDVASGKVAIPDAQHADHLKGQLDRWATMPSGRLQSFNKTMRGALASPNLLMLYFFGSSNKDEQASNIVKAAGVGASVLLSPVSFPAGIIVGAALATRS